MKLSGFMTQQFGKPDGLFGRFFMGPYLDFVNKKSIELVFQALQIQADSRVLEVGFGGGSFLLRAARKVNTGTIDGLELSEPMLKHVMHRMKRMNTSNNVTLRHGSIEQLPYEQNQFDRICSVNTVYFWPDIDQGIKQMTTVLQPGGKLVLGFGCSEAMAKNGYHKRGFKLYSPDEIAETYKNNGLQIDQLMCIDRKNRGPFYAYRAVKPHG